MKSRSGFTLVEVMITIVILFVVIDSMMLFFLNVMAEYRRQSKITETGIETVIGLEVLRKDVESAGYALPWNHLPAYDEAASGVPTSALNDPSATAPRAVVNGVGMGPNGSDILVVKSVSVGTDEACKRWTTLQEGDVKRIWSDNSLNFLPGNQVVVLATDIEPATQRDFVAITAYNNTAGSAPTTPVPRLVHGLTDSIAPRMPFNRADYFISTDNVPRLCAPNTGVLVKSVIRQDTGDRGPFLPLLDCVRDVRIAFGLNTLGTDPTVDCVVATP
ncbi:MAG TPA: prepilin-type N-terminal cleavage/methylation domain-containing protein, partial [Candidatus Deferrimicrobiaceae bacterium]